MKYLISSLLLLAITSVFAQKVVVQDAITQEVLGQVAIVDLKSGQFVTTNDNGAADLTLFSAQATLSFTHVGYEEISRKKADLLKSGIVWLNPDSERLSEIILSVSRSTDRKKRLAQQVSVMTEQAIAQQNPENTAVLLRQMPGIRVQQSQGGGGSPVLRGFEANRVLLVVDGVRLNNAIFRSGHLHNVLSVDPLSLSRMEVIFGPSSVGYGSDALGGVIHFYTKTPLINQEKKSQLSGSSSYTFGQNTTKQSLLFEYSSNKWAMLQQISYANFGDIIMGKHRPHGYLDWGKTSHYSQNTASYYTASPTETKNTNKQFNTGYAQLDLLQKWIYHARNGAKITLNIQGSQSGEISRYDKLSEYDHGVLRFARWDYGPQKRLLISTQLSFVGNKRWLQSGKITAAVQLLEESRIKRKFSSLIRETQRERLAVYSLNADFKAKTAKGKDWSYGVELTHNDVHSQAFAQELIVDGNSIKGLMPKVLIPTRYPSGGSSYSTFAVYTDYRHDLSPRSTLTFGARHTMTKLRALWNEQALIDASLDEARQSHQSSTATLGYSHIPNQKWQFKGLLSSGFRAPNIDDLGKTRENNGRLTVPNVLLKPEYIYSTDIGVRRQWGNRSFVELNGYYAYVQDYIARGDYYLAQDTSTVAMEMILYSGDVVQTIANINVGGVRMYGMSGQVAWNITSKIRYNGTITITKGEGNSISGNLPSISPLFLSQQIQYTLPKGAISLHLNHAQAKAANDYSPWGEDGLEETPLLSNDAEQPLYAGTPSWHRLDIKMDVPISSSVHFSGGVFNILDDHYREFASGISAPGRSVRVALRYSP